MGNVIDVDFTQVMSKNRFQKKFADSLNTDGTITADKLARLRASIPQDTTETDTLRGFEMIIASPDSDDVKCAKFMADIIAHSLIIFGGIDDDPEEIDLLKLITQAAIIGTIDEAAATE